MKENKFIFLQRFLKDKGIPYDVEQIGKFEGYMDGILNWNEKVNLTAIKDEEEFEKKHYIDSLYPLILKEYNNAEKIVDLGTGAGFPGVPLAIMSPNKIFTLVDSLKKRLNIIDELTEKEGILNCTTIHGRAEDIGRNKEYRESFDLCVSRAVAAINVLAEYALPLVKVGGYLLAYKGPDIDNELKKGRQAIKVLGGEIEGIINFNTNDMNHNILIVKKVKQTSMKFPRKAGTPAKTPL